MPTTRHGTKYEGRARATGDGTEERPRRGSGELSAVTAGQVALRQITELTGKDTEGVTLVEPSDDGWRVGIEVIEDRRIPSSGDILAVYEIDLDMDGNLLSYRRARRYKRASGDEGKQ
jgi:hypothetical protein